MSAAAEAVSSGKGHRDENFPVASWLIAPHHRPIILAFYRFVRAADDVADHASLPPEEKLALIDRLERSLLGREDSEPAGVALRDALMLRRLPPRHALDLLSAFRLDVTKHRYVDWDDLMDYCAFSAMPVGRFVLDVHGEARSTWPASDALCAALQVINHLQDCGKDYRDLDRVYIPGDAFAAAGSEPRGAGGATCLARAARLHPRSGRAHGGPSGGGRALRPPDRRPAPRLGGFRDPSPGGAPHRRSRPARSLERARSSLGSRIGAAGAPGHGADAAEPPHPSPGGEARLGASAMTQAAGASEAIETAAAEGPPSTAARSSGSSFYTAMRVLPAPQRDAMYEIYAFCRAVDDIADGEAPQAERRAGLERWRADIDRLYAGEPPAGLGRLAATAQRFGLAREDFLAVIDGMEMDVEQDIRAPDFATLDLYCDRVASAVGRLSVQDLRPRRGGGARPRP